MGSGAPRNAPPEAGDAQNAAVGLCSACSNARQIQSSRGSIFWLCEAATNDSRLRKYPQLPVLRCHAFVARSG
jgi:hypothetical protein